MALSKFEKDMQIIQALDDEPNDVGGMSSAELKATFDEGGEAVKQFLNGVLIPALDTYIARTDNPHFVTKAQVGLGNCDNTADDNKPVSAAQTAAIAAAKAEAVSAAASDATTKASAAKAEAIATSDTLGAAAAAVSQHNTAGSGVHAALFAGKLDKTGGTLTGPLALSGAPTVARHAATKQYVDEVSAGVVLGQIPDGSITSEKLSGGVNTTLATSTVHVGRTDNPHGVTAAQIGAATDTALEAHAGRTDNPHAVNCAQIGAQPATTAINTGNIGNQSVNYANNANAVGGYSAAQLLAAAATASAKIVYGSYTGTGTYSEAMPTSITFPFEPKLVMIVKTPNDASANRGFYWNNGWSNCAIWVKGMQLEQNTGSVLWFTLDGNTLKYGANANAAAQLNESGTVYSYIGIG